MHGILFLLTVINYKYDISKEYPATYKSVQLIAVLLEVYNLCMMLKLYGESVINGLKVTKDTQEFQFWMLIEIITIFTSICTTMLYLILRASGHRDQIGESASVDALTDETEVGDRAWEAIKHEVLP